LRGFAALFDDYCVQVGAENFLPLHTADFFAFFLRHAARGIEADVPPFPEGNGGTGADSPTAAPKARAARPKPLYLLRFAAVSATQKQQ
jgi:hypothetical protein